MHYSFYIGLVFLGCCSNVIFLELLTSAYPACGNLITFAQFVFITIKGFIQETKFGTKKPSIPIKNYLLLVAIFFVVSILNNYALNFNISMPLHMIFRSGSLIANMILGIIILHKRYKLREYLSIFMITVGIFICTLVSSNEISKKEEVKHDEHNVSEFFWWIIGILMLSLSLFLSSSMGIIQETLYKKYGKHPDEALFYNHALTLPLFIFFTNDLINQVNIFNKTEPIDVLFISLPIMWIYLILNTLTQYVCISSVFVLTTECPSLIVTLVTTLRKFVSLIISIIYFGNPFTLWHWFGTILVFAGTLWFMNIITMVKDYMSSSSQKVKKSE